jgi:ABC-type multidrug transport system ATPase subunit
MVEIQLSFKNLSFDVKTPSPSLGDRIRNLRKPTTIEDIEKELQPNQPAMGYKRILANVSGTFHPGTITAIMGSSGAGKPSFVLTAFR